VTDQLDRLKSALSDRYTVERKLGEGGMATVYLAHDTKQRWTAGPTEDCHRST
jgi:hypothetical protein